MAYYAALISLKQTIQRLLNSSQISILSPSRVILESVSNEVRSFQAFLHANEEIIIDNSTNERVNLLHGQIRDTAYKLEDAIESRISIQSDQSLGEEGFPQEVFLDVEEVMDEINSFIETVKKIKKMMMEELSKPLPEEEDIGPLKIDLGRNNLKLVGFSEEFNVLKDKLINGLSSGRDVVSITGMAGIGKTALATKLFEDPSISGHFGPRAFVKIGQKFQFKKVMLSILAQMDHDIDEICVGKDEDLAELIRNSLQGKKYLIVLDDVWNIKHLYKLESLLPKESNRSRVLVTTRINEVAFALTLNSGHSHRMRLLRKEKSWDLLCEKVFGEGYLCPIQLEKFGKKIAENCEGLPLTIVTIANILSKREKTLESWKMATEKENLVFKDAYEQMSDTLIKSYNYLPQYLKPYFLYMGVFPLRCEIRTSKFEKFWHSEGLSEDFEDNARKYLLKLFCRNIILANERSSSCGIKICKLHSVYWYLCVKQASKEKFFHVINHYPSSFAQGIKSQRRLCIHNNVLFAIKEVHNSMDSVSMARSLLCTGPHHQYPVPICFGLRLLRVLDALTIRFYEFPFQVLKLVQLRYLALTYSGKVPGSISKLWNLEDLIVYRHIRINKSSGDSSYLPMEIWNMKELRHIQIRGVNLPYPCGAPHLPNLLTLSNMRVNSCSREILERTPNLKKLGIQIELPPDVVEPLCCFDHFSHLHLLESLKCAVVNPKPRSQVIASITTFPPHLKKLSLSGLGYPWEYMRTIAKLPNLEVLKLRSYAFQGPVWETYIGEFLQLKYLLLEDMDLMHWRADSIHCFPLLRFLVISSCYKLKEIPLSFGCNSKCELMWLANCPSFRASEKRLREEYQFRVTCVRSSLDNEK